MVIVFGVGILLGILINDVPSLLFLSLGGFAGSLFLFLMGKKKDGTVRSVMIFSQLFYI